MTETWQISNEAPERIGGLKRNVAYPFESLHEGQSLIIAASEIANFPKIRSAASAYAKRHGVWLRCYKKDDGTLQIYRDKDDSGKQGGGRRATSPAAPSTRLQAATNKLVTPPTVHHSQQPMRFPPPAAESTPPPVPASAIPGPTLEQWNAMLHGMPVDTALQIPFVYISLFNQMQEWTTYYSEFLAPDDKKYSAIVVGSELRVSCKTPVQEDENEGLLEFEPQADMEADLESIPLEVATPAEQLTADREAAKLAPNRDGWTRLPCRTCAGVSGGCAYCSGTGRFYDKDQDDRQIPPPPAAQPDPASLLKIAAAIENAGNHGGLGMSGMSRSDRSENYE